MKKFILFIFVIVSMYNLQAQYVNIPDENLKSALKEILPQCFNEKGQLNKDCSEVKSLNNLQIKRKGIKNLDGLQYFSMLEELDCSRNEIMNLNFIPSTLKYLNCSNNEIEILNNLPPLLLEFDCSNNKIKEIPQLPNTLRIFYCMENSIVKFINLPNSLYDFNCSYNQIVQLPNFNTKDSNLKEIDCSYNPKLKCLPELPVSVKKIQYQGTKIQCIPNKPYQLEKDIPVCETKCN